jgi:ubiquinone biosynthesis protein UbiJ
MAGDVALEFLKMLQQSIAALDHKITKQRAILTQDVRMILDVTEREMAALHEDVNRVQQSLDELATRGEILEGQRI